MFNTTSRPMPVGSIIFSIVALLVISLVVLLILRHYLPLRSTPAFYSVPIFFAIWLPSVIVLLVPIDLASSSGTDDDGTRGIWLPERVILVSWRITYWLTFALTWFLLPILGEYSDAGYREPYDRLMYSLRSNAQFYSVIVGSAIIGLVYVVVRYDVTYDSLKSVVMALAYCWGLIFAIYLMGHGLVSIPKRLIRDANIANKLHRMQAKAPKAYEKMEDSVTSLEEIEAQVAELAKRKVGSAADFRDWIEELQEIANIAETRPHATAFDVNTMDRTVPNIFTPKYLADLTRRLVRAKHARSRFAHEWHDLVNEAGKAQRILDSAASKKLEFGDASPHAGIWDKAKLLNPYTRYLWHYQIGPYMQIGLGVLLAMASACIVWSEVVKLPFPHLSIIRLSVIHHWVGDKAEVGFAGQVISAFWICYMCAAALVTMTEVKVWRGRALVRRNTGYEAAFWYAMQVAKLTVPLSYNFLTFLSSEVYTKTAFYGFLGRLIDFTHLGRWFDDLFPYFLIIPVLAATFGLYGRAKRLFVGIDLLDDDEENLTGYGTGSWREGRDLIERELGGETVRRRDELFARLAAAGSGNNRAAPVLSVPPGESASRGAPRTIGIGSATGAQRAGASSSHRYLDDAPEDDSLIQIIGHRMKNTVDNIETPKWFQDLGQGFKKPKWMGGGESSSAGSERSDIRSWFGGNGSSNSSGGGQIRL
ncbi:LMBR1-like conserved region [Cordyceps militaris CM01]|uniref:LMBR1-like conserved region n=1 Tax=Cordyceps militaris (strain CM01) TaxID=983644 RepID=G3J5L0_CORMM|nr:LMBR1-like conserved region [Cordyceps militaris CM01]EGX96866.1 LMBR1-like conserved region [Cordyceps militaris CM01]